MREFGYMPETTQGTDWRSLQATMLSVKAKLAAMQSERPEAMLLTVSEAEQLRHRLDRQGEAPKGLPETFATFCGIPIEVHPDKEAVTERAIQLRAKIGHKSVLIATEDYDPGPPPELDEHGRQKTLMGFPIYYPDD